MLRGQPQDRHTLLLPVARSEQIFLDGACYAFGLDLKALEAGQELRRQRSQQLIETAGIEQPALQRKLSRDYLTARV